MPGCCKRLVTSASIRKRRRLSGDALQVGQRPLSGGPRRVKIVVPAIHRNPHGTVLLSYCALCVACFEACAAPVPADILYLKGPGPCFQSPAVAIILRRAVH